MWVFLNDKLTIRFFQTSSCTTNASLYLEKYCPAFWLFYSFFCFFWFVTLSFWETPDGHFKTSKKKDLNKRFLGRAIFRITRLFLVFLNVHLQYICLPPNYIAAASTLGREPMGKVRKTISIFGVSRRPEKIVFSVQLPGVINHPLLSLKTEHGSLPYTWAPCAQLRIVINIRNFSEEQNSQNVTDRAYFPVLIMIKILKTSFPNPYYNKMFLMLMIYEI